MNNLDKQDKNNGTANQDTDNTLKCMYSIFTLKGHM